MVTGHDADGKAAALMILHGPLRSPFSTGTLSLGAGCGGFENDVGAVGAELPKS
jgi:hypothetical protein